MSVFSTGKLPVEFLEHCLGKIPITDPRVKISGRVGEDAAVIDCGGRFLLAKSDPITFATDRPGWYAVQVNANDIAAMGGTCRWFLATLLLPESGAGEKLVGSIFDDIASACSELNIQLVGGHTEITHGLPRTIVCGMMLGEAGPDTLCGKERISEGDRLLLTKALAVEGTSLIAREFPDRAGEVLTGQQMEKAAQFLYDPGISVVREARLAVETGFVSAMHDPTEGGLVSALCELGAASGKGLAVDLLSVPVYSETKYLCAHLGLDPLGLIASGSLLIVCSPEGSGPIADVLQAEGIACTEIGEVVGAEEGLTEIVEGERRALRKFERDEICRLFAQGPQQGKTGR